MVQIDLLGILDEHGALGHFHHGGGTGPGARLVDRNEGLMQHPADVDIAAGSAQPGEIRPCRVKGQLHAHALQHAGKLSAVCGLELGQRGEHRVLGGPGKQGLQGCAVQRRQIVLGADAVLGQQGHKGVFPVLKGLDEAHSLVVLQILMLLPVHEIHGLFGAVGAGEVPGQHRELLIGREPLRFKGQSVHQIHHSIGRQILQHLGDHSVGLLLDPVVQSLQGLPVKGGLEDVRAVEVGVGLQEAAVDREPGIGGKPDGVCQLQGVVPGKGLHIGQEIGVQQLPAQAQGALHLLQGLPFRPVGRHGQGAQNGQRRDQRVLFGFVGGPEQAEGKVRRSGGCRGIQGAGLAPVGDDLIHQVHHMDVGIRRRLGDCFGRGILGRSRGLGRRAARQLQRQNADQQQAHHSEQMFSFHLNTSLCVAHG